MSHDRSATAPSFKSPSGTKADLSADLVLPLIAEELEISKHQVANATVRLTKIVHETPELIREFLTAEQFVVERVPMDEVVATPPAMRVEEDVIVIPVIEEVLVVKKEFRLKEELRITKKHAVNEHRQEVTLRSEELVVERFSKDSTEK